MGRGDAERHADQDAHDGREADERDRLDRRLPISEIGDGDERDDNEDGQAPRPMHPVGERGQRKNDDEKRDVQQYRGEAVNQEIDHRGHRVEKTGGVVLQPGDADLDQASERKFRLREPTLQGRPSSLLRGACGSRKPGLLLPSCGGGWEGGRAACRHFLSDLLDLRFSAPHSLVGSTPHPNPPPQGGRENARLSTGYECEEEPLSFDKTAFGSVAQRPRLALTAASPGLPSKVVTPSSQVASWGGLVFSHSCAAFGPSSPSVRILFITRFSISTV